MWLYHRGEKDSNPFRESPFPFVMQISYLPHPLPWIPYPHFHGDEFEFACMLGGQGTLQLPGTEVKLSAGSLVLIPPGTAHCYRMDPWWNPEYFTIRFRAGEAGSPLREAFREPRTIEGTAADPEAFRDVFLLLQKKAVRGGGLIDRTIQSLCLAILEMAQDEWEKSGQTVETSTPEYASDILQYLQEHKNEKLTLADLSEEFSLSQSHLSRVFQQTYHISPINYLIYSRMREARTYILNDNLPPEEIARKLAFHDVYHFQKTFEKFFKCKPEHYREYAKATEDYDPFGKH